MKTKISKLFDNEFESFMYFKFAQVLFSKIDSTICCTGKYAHIPCFSLEKIFEVWNTDMVALIPWFIY